VPWRNTIAYVNLEYKKAIIEALFDLVKFIPAAKVDCLAILSEYIE
jgi:hypothetical protein